MTKASDFKIDQEVQYVPYHAHGDASHPDCEYGRVTSINERAGVVFARFGKKLTSEGCNPDQLRAL